VIALLTAALLAAQAGAPQLQGRRELASGAGAVTADVGQVALRLRVRAARVEISEGPAGKVTVSTPEARDLRLRLFASGKRVEPEFDGRRQLDSGRLVVQVPKGSAVDVSSVSGDVSIQGLGAEARVRGMSGRVLVAAATDVDVETVDGDIRAVDVAGAVRVHTVSGSTTVSARQPAAKLEVESASGPVDWQGTCGAGCHLDIDTVSGPVTLSFQGDSSFAISYATHQGRLRDELPLSQRPQRKGSTWAEAAFGQGDGLVECETFSGDITVRPAR
jgi:hypothetical protein